MRVCRAAPARRLLLIATALLVTAGGISMPSSVAATTDATAVVPVTSTDYMAMATDDATGTPCLQSDAFGPSMASMQHIFRCKTGYAIPVVTWEPAPGGTADDADGVPDGSITQADDAPAGATLGTTTTDGGTIAPDAPGGPSCEWAEHYISEWCYHSGGEKSLVCIQFFYSTDYNLHGHHCANPYYAGPNVFSQLWNRVKSVFANHAFRRCLAGAIPGTVGGVIIRGLKGGGVAGIVVNGAMGCVGGITSYFWH